jgi:HD-GYP domain-containing protein (c-di-GMP phosphodiesterase class II)
LRVLARVGVLHDIGKLGIPDSILGKQGPLDEMEWKEIRRHPQIGLEIIAGIGGMQREADAVFSHHERMDGSGYPRGLRGDAIPLEARIIAVADTYDAVRSDRPYCKARSQAEAVAILRHESGTHLYPQAVEALVRLTGREQLPLHLPRAQNSSEGLVSHSA